MKRPFYILLFISLFALKAQSQMISAPNLTDTKKVSAVVSNGDTMLYQVLPDFYVFKPLIFKNKRESAEFYRLVRDVKKVLPLAKYVKQVIIETNDTLMKMNTKRQRDAFMVGFEKRLYKQNEARFKNMTFRQGKLLIRLIDRECDNSSYQLIKIYRGSFKAGFYQAFAFVFGASLKVEFGSRPEDQKVDLIIDMIEAGRL